MDLERENPRDNVIAGTVGTFLGSLIGVACIVIFSRLGYVSAVAGLVMAVGGKRCGSAKAIRTFAPPPGWNAPKGRRPPAGYSFPSLVW